MEKVLLTNQAICGNNYAQRYGGHEYNAAKAAGFTVIELPLASILFKEQKSNIDLTGIPTFIRHYANEDSFFRGFVEGNNGKFIVPSYQKANEWYKVVPNDALASYWLGGRSVSWMDLRGLDPDNNLGKYKRDMTIAMFTVFEKSRHGKVFVKSPQKRSLPATLYTKSDLEEDIGWQMAMNVHGKLHEIIYSEPMDIATRKTGFKREEYRCLIVGEKCSSVSLYTDIKRKRDYSEIERFANEFAEHFYGRLPKAYCLDICRLIDTSLAVVEINDIAAFGFYADNNIYKFFEDIYALD